MKSGTLPTKRVLTLACAREIAEAALASAVSKNLNHISIAVSDDGGRLLYFLRQDDAEPATVDIATAKAYTAAIFKKPGKHFKEMLLEGKFWVLGMPNLTPVEGGQPIIVDGRTIGGIGIAGATGVLDTEIGSAGLAVLNWRIEASMGKSRIEEIPPEALSATQTAVIAKLVADRGRVPTPFKVWLHSPVLAECLQDLGSYLAGGASLRRREAKIAILLIAAHWRADYVFKMQAREALDAGLPGEVVDAIANHREGLDQPLFTDPREQVIYALVRAFTQSAAIDDRIFDAAVDRLGHAGVADLLATCGYFTSVALAMKLYQPP